MKNVAIVMCSRTKKEYACSAQEMYEDSLIFEAKKTFVELFHDEWFINTKYGFVAPTEIIEPYDFYMTKTHKLGKDMVVMDDEMVDEWIDLVKDKFQDWEKPYINLHCHIAKPYVDKLREHYPNIVYYSGQPNNTLTAHNYIRAIDKVVNGGGASLEECKNIIEYKEEPLVENPQWWYHNEPPYEYYGKSHQLSKSQGVDYGGSFRTAVGNQQHISGWVIDKDLLPYINKTESGRYKLDKKYVKPTKYRVSNLWGKLNKLKDEIYG